MNYTLRGVGFGLALASALATVNQAQALPGPCYAAHSHGSYGPIKPCGCFAQGYVFGSYERWMMIGGRKVNLWLADTWRLIFPHTRPHRGAVAVWPGRHVAPVDGDPKIIKGVEYVTVVDSWRTHDVRTAGLVFVDPHR